MQRSLDARLRKLEARIETPSPFDELNYEQKKALGICIDAELDRRAGLDSEVTDELLWNNAMSRESYDAALASISPEMWEGIWAHARSLEENRT